MLSKKCCGVIHILKRHQISGIHLVSPILRPIASIKLKQNKDIIICGDFNAKLKIKDQNESSTGKILNSFVKRNKLCVMNHSDKCTGHWTRMEGDSKSVIDYIITSSDSIKERIEFH